MIFLKKKSFPTKMNFCYLFCDAFLHCVQIRIFFWSAFSVFGHFSHSFTLLRLLRNKIPADLLLSYFPSLSLSIPQES